MNLAFPSETGSTALKHLPLAVEGHVFVRGELVELPGLTRRGIERGALFPRLPAIIVAGPRGDHRLAGGERRRLLVPPALGKEPGLHAVVWLPDDQQMVTVLLEDHRCPSSVLACLIGSLVASTWECLENH